MERSSSILYGWDGMDGIGYHRCQTHLKIQFYIKNVNVWQIKKMKLVFSSIPSGEPCTTSHSTLLKFHQIPRLGICRDRHDRQSCKIFVNCVNFSRKQRSFLHILQVYTHPNVHTLFNFSLKRAKLLIIMHFCCLLLAKIVSF